MPNAIPEAPVMAITYLFFRFFMWIYIKAVAEPANISIDEPAFR